MKAHLAKLSLALLSTVFLLGCQDMGSEPVGPEGLGPEFGHKTTHNPGGKDDDRPTYYITVSRDISSPRTLTRALRSPEHLRVDDVSLNLSFFDDKLTCDLGEQQGSIAIDLGRGGDHLHLFFSFELDGASHNIGFLLEVPTTWPPIDIFELSEDDRQWAVRNVSKNRGDGCTGDGAAGAESGIDFTILIEPVAVVGL